MIKIKYGNTNNGKQFKLPFSISHVGERDLALGPTSKEFGIPEFSGGGRERVADKGVESKSQ